MESTDYSETGLLKLMSELEYSIRKLRIVMTNKVPTGYYEGEVERFRKYSTKLHIKRSL